MSNSDPQFTTKQGQYLAFIDAYTVLNGRPPAQADFQHFFAVTPPTVHQMIIGLEKNGFITRIPRQPRALKIRISVEGLPRLQPIKTTVDGY